MTHVRVLAARCVECGGSESSCAPQQLRGSVNGSGIPDANMVIYVACSPCEDETTIAYTGSCQQESRFDRYIDLGCLN